jgi:pilus assembly protein CpaF
MLAAINALIDDDVTDVLIGSASGVWLQRATGATRAQLELSEEQARALAVQLIDMGGRHLDDASPCVDVRLGDGVRVHAALTPVSVSGTEISIRLPHRRRLSLDDFVIHGVLTQPQLALLRSAVDSRLTVLISGSAGAGKTTFLGAMMSCIPSTERIITIEDVAELRINHDRRVALETRQANSEGRGAIDIAELIRQSLRMRPDRLVVGECRGAEVVDMLRAFTTGHSGGGSTIHANSLEDVAVRLDSLGALAGITSEAMARLAAAAIDLVVHISQTGSQRQVEIGRVKARGGVLEIIPLEGAVSS